MIKEEIKDWVDAICIFDAYIRVKIEKKKVRERSAEVDRETSNKEIGGDINAKRRKIRQIKV